MLSCVSPSQKRTFSTMTTPWPSTSSGGATRRPPSPSSSASRAATGRSEKAGSTPLGRPRWASSVRRSTPLPRSSRIVGSAAVIRASSRIWPSSSGTLKSTRATTARPSRSPRSSSVRKLEDLLDQVGEAVGVAPLVVVPADHLHQRAVEDRGEAAVDDRGVGVGDDVGGDDRVLGVLQDAREVTGVGLAREEVVDLLHAGLAVGLEG